MSQTLQDTLQDEDWHQLVYSLGQGQCILLVGPGVDVTLTDGTSCNLADTLARKLGKELNEAPPETANLSHVAQRYVRAKGRNYLNGALSRFFDEHQVSTDEETFFTHLAKLPFRLIVTTRHDRALDKYLEAAGKEPVVASFDIQGAANAFLEPGTVERPLVYYLAGDLANPSSLIVTEEDILRFLMAVVSREPEVPSAIRSEFKTGGRMFLLVGFGIQHWYTRVLLSVLGAEESDSRSLAIDEFKAFARSSDSEAFHFFKQEFKIDTLFDDPREILATLAERWEATGSVKEGGNGEAQALAPPSANAPRVFISYVQEDLEHAESLFQAMQKKGLSPFWDKDGLRGGDDWDSVLKREVAEADYFVVLQSERLAKRTFSFVNKEVTLALDKQSQAGDGVRFIVPLLLDESDPLPSLGDIQSIQAKNSDQVGAAIDHIARDYERRLRR